MGVLRRIAPLVASIVLVIATGTLGVVLTRRANDKAERTHARDRENMQTTLAGLGKQYLLFSAKEPYDFAATGTWSLAPGDGADRDRLTAFLAHSALFNYGVALVGLDTKPLNLYAPAGPVPPPTDPGYAPMITALKSGQPGVSSVMVAGGAPVVAVGVPVMVANQPKALIVAYLRTDRSPLQTYVDQLHYGRTGRAYVVDSAGRVVASTGGVGIGTPLPAGAVLDALRRGRSGLLTYDDAGVPRVATFAPLGQAGWGAVTTQTVAEFYGPIRSGHLRIQLALVALLALAAITIGVLGYKRETARRRFQEALAHQATHDVLTGLANRALLYEHLASELAQARRHGRDVAVLYVDLDRFKPINDQLGHEAGDAVLVEVAARLVSSIRAGDLVARLGGDEFVIVLHDVASDDAATEVAERVVAAVGHEFVTAGTAMRTGASVGIAVSRGGGSDAEALLRDADLAMYKAKDGGRHRWVAFDDELRSSRR